MFGLVAIAFPICVQAQTDSAQTRLDSILRDIQKDPLLVRMGEELFDARGRVWEAYSLVYEDVLLCDPSDHDAILDTACFLGLSQKLAKTGDLLRVYAKLLKQNKTPVSIMGLDIYVKIEKNPPNSNDLEEIVMKFTKASNDVIVCVRGRATEGPCSSVGLSVSDAVNSLGIAMGLMKK